MTVFVDTSAIFSSLDADDKFHSQSLSAWQNLTGSGQVLITSNYVVLEAISILHRRLGLEFVRKLNDLITPLLSVEWIDEELHRLAVSAMLHYSRSKVNLVDYSSFLLMWRLNIQEVFTFDKHFKDQGFDVIP
ncbi:MAG: PIN domain-containing protein [Actinobacteria bacterium]|nr:PIN domain-containing protein [Actinomycetota bacterium]MBU1943140.1 PIN domain-containing protein [Actinomycetota bacterium]MBU2687913.1 PIN domain-containing protein [Actinomycetota bacterium]